MFKLIDMEIVTFLCTKRFLLDPFSYSVNKKSSPKRVSATPVSYAGPIPGCKCSSCQEGLGSDDDMSHYSDHLMEEEPRYAVK